MPLKLPPFKFSSKNFSLKNVFIVFACLFIALISFTRVFDPYENILFDLRFRLRPIQPVSDKIVIIEISDDTLKQLGYWPIPRDFHASLIDILSYYGAKEIMFDLILTDPSEKDDILEEAIRQGQNVYLPSVLRAVDEGAKRKIPHADGAMAALLPRFAQTVRGTGFINSFKDGDGKTRRAPLFMEFHGRKEAHIALRIACDYLGLPFRDIVFRRNSVTIDGKVKIPVSESGAMLVNYAGKWGKTFQHYSYVDILTSWLESSEGKKPRVDLENLRGKICLVGLTATGTPDLQPTPLENNYPMVGLHANLINSVLLNRFIKRADEAANLILLFILLAGVVYLTRRYKNRPTAAFSATLGAILGFGVFSLVLFCERGIWIDVFCPVIFMALTNTGMSIYNFLEESRKRELIEKELSIAKAIQESFLPVPLQEFRGLTIALSMLTAKHVGGDLYDMCELGKSNLGVFIGDVSGKGVPAALVMAKTISLFRMFAYGADEPSDLLFQLNEEMVRSAQSGIFVTATYIIYSAQERQVLIASAGHLPTFIVRAKSGNIESVELEEGMPLGLMERLEFSQKSVTLEEGDSLVLYTDGVIESKNLKREDFGEERLKAALISHRQQSPAEILKAAQEQFQAFAGKAPQHDDCTMIILQQKKSS